MKLFYIDDNVNKVINKFELRVPQSRMTGEDSKTLRVCASKSLSGCLSAVPWQEDIEYMDDNCILRVYEFEVSDEDVINSEYLYENALVDDAMITEEYWIMKSVVPAKIYDILIEECWYDPVGVIPYNYVDTEEFDNYISTRQYTLSKYKVIKNIKD